MSLFENTLAELAVRTLRVPLHDYRGGTATGGSTSTVVDTNDLKQNREADDYFQNTSPVSQVHISSTTDGQAPVGETRTISDFVNSTGTLSVTPNFSVTVGADDTYAILSEYKWNELREAINMAIEQATQSRVLIEKIDESLTFQSDTYEYTLPDGFVYIYRIAQVDANGDYPDPIPFDHYRVIRAYGMPKLHFYRFPALEQYLDHWYGQLFGDSDLTDGRVMRIEGLGKQAKLVDDNDVCYLDPNFITYQAAAFLHAARISANDPDQHKAQFEICQGQADRFLSGARTILPPNTKKVVQ